MLGLPLEERPRGTWPLCSISQLPASTSSLAALGPHIRQGRAGELLKASVTGQNGLCDTKLLGAILQSGKYTRPGRDRNNVIENEIGKSLQFF